MIQKEEQKAMYLQIVETNHYLLCDMVKCEIVNNRVDPLSSTVFESLAHRIEEIRSDQWEGLVFL